MVAIISIIATRSAIIILVHIGVTEINAQFPSTRSLIDRAREIFQIQETVVLHCTKHIAHIIVADIKSIIILVESPAFSPQRIVHYIAYGIKEIVIDFVNIIYLRRI